METRFILLWQYYSGTTAAAAAAFSRLAAKYAEPNRPYHNLGHIEDCLAQLDACGPERHSHALELALWFHDVIYNSHRSDNEAQSSLFFAGEAAALDPAVVAQVRQLIDVTARHQASTPEEALICDIDLSILGRDPAVYQSYAAAIRQEYD